MAKDVFREYVIPFIGLKEGKNHFKFEIDDSFFTKFDSDTQEFSDADIKVEMVLDKKPSFLTLDFFIEGSLKVVCDRCANEFRQELLDEHRVYVKFHEQASEMEEEEDVIYLSTGESHINVAKLLYEFVLLSIPIQKVCPPLESGENGCNQEVLKMLGGDEPPSNENDKNTDEDTDPRWSALKKLK
ncbi:MAG: DUF177 domain-containing protein [Chitinophagales bacterium]|nr:DUF177 domain-containing protein [Chitinophagales bacterium]